MLLTSLSLLFSLSFLDAAVVALLPAAACAPVHIIVARASGEAPGEGVIAKLATQIKRALPGTTSEALKYPAKMPYSGSIPVGVTNMKKAIAAYTQSCPQGKLVLMGYSQGGAVLVDTLCGGGGPQVGPSTPGLTAEEGKLIKAAVSMGDPRFVPGTSYDLGTNRGRGGVAQRDRNVAQCPVWASKIQSYCDQNDSRCASGSSLQVHMSYLDRYQKAAADYILKSVR